MQRTKAQGHVGNRFTDGDPGVTEATIVDQLWLNDTQEEIVKVIEDRGITLADLTPTQLMQAIQLIAEGYGAPLYENLLIKPNGVNSLHQVDITTDFIKVGGWKFTPGTITVDITVSAAAGGRDYATAEKSSTWHDIYTIADISNPAAPVIGGLLVEAGQVPVLPGAFTLSERLGAVYNDSSGDFVTFVQRGNRFITAGVTVVASGAATIYTGVSLSAAVPPQARKVGGVMLVRLAVGAYVTISCAADSAGKGEQTVAGYTSGSLSQTGSFELALSADQSLNYKVGGGGESGDIIITQWEY